MSKPELPFYTSAIFYGIATIIGPPSAHAQPPPPGGYQQSCRDSHIQGSTLVSSCKDRGQTFRPTELRDFTQCLGDIFNDNGTLRCNRGALPPPGSYARSCEQTFVDGQNLRGNCRNRGGGLAATTLLDYRRCTGDISNDDGALRCSRGGLPPAGSYTASCRSSFMDGQTLTSICRTVSGSEVPTTLTNVDACRSSIANIDGRLTCTTGSGPVPPGTYASTCRDIVVAASSITASCRTQTGGERTSTMANPASCRSPIDNIDGFLSCSMGSTTPPPGSYRATCHDVVANGSTLSAVCRRGDGSYQQSSLDFAGCQGSISNHQGILTCPTPAPSIAVQSKGDGSFVVTGSSFLANSAVHIRVADGALGNNVFFSDTSNPEGKLLGFPTGKICQRSGQLFFSANDGRVSDGTAVTSNIVTTTCPF